MRGASRRTVDRTIELHATAVGIGQYLYLPFQVPDGVNRVAVSMRRSGEASIGVGLFDHRGPDHGSPGFRGVYGDEVSSFFVAADRASRGFRPGRIEPGTWTVVVPVFRALIPVRLDITVTLSFGPQPPEALPGPEPGVVREAPGWYRGDVHNHTTHSSDAYGSGSALEPAEYPAAMREAGLDWAVLTDHNCTTSGDHLADAVADSGVLLIGGMELTNWPHGHATVTGLDPGDWLDWRARPAGVALGRYERRIGTLVNAVRERGAYLSAAHPLSGHLSWQFLAEQVADPSLLPDGFEVWNGPHEPKDEAALVVWDSLLRAGHRVFANGGSDLHGTADPDGSGLGIPTTVVYAESLSRRDVVAALKAGRSFITSAPDGPELYLEAAGPDGQQAMPGGEIRGPGADVVTFSVLVRRGAGRALVLLRDGVAAHATPISADEQTVTIQQSIGVGGYLRAELRGTSAAELGDPVSSRTRMAALTNPIFLVRTGVPTR